MNRRKVISASRRVDMVACYPQRFVEILNEKCPPERVHTLVIWTKNPYNLIHKQFLREKLCEYDQLFLHYSITGLGGSILEPQIPKTEIALEFLPELIKLVDGPERIRIRFDPIVHLRMPDGSVRCNLQDFKMIGQRITALGLKNVSISWMQLYNKVIARLARHGIEPIEIGQTQWQKEAEWLLSVADSLGITIHGCCVPGWPTGRCIDGDLYNALHPKGYVCSVKRAKSQRELCGCTESWDIGWYWKCFMGCVYCYANPV